MKSQICDGVDVTCTDAPVLRKKIPLSELLSLKNVQLGLARFFQKRELK